MNDKDKRGFSSLSDLASGINEVDDSVSAEIVSDEKRNTITKSMVPNEEHGIETDVDKIINQPLPQKSLFVKIVKTIGGISIGVVLIILAVFIYGKYQENKQEQKELTYHYDFGWRWHDEFNRIQIWKPSDSKKPLFLRKVYLDNKYVIYAYKDKDYKLVADVYFITPCEPGTKITTSKKFSDGNLKELICDADGKSLSFGCMWNSNDTNVVWEEDLDGFSFREDFGQWDFKKLDQEITMSKAK
jgi:hypothetical protein